jgi:CubicO group peptidase (beta-lactamase class C family)
MKIAAPEKHGFDGSRLRAIDTFLKERYLDSGEFANAQLLVSRDGEIVHFSSQGAAREGGSASIDEGSLFRIASMTKPITSVAFMMLVEECKVALDTPVHHVLPEFKKTGVYAGGGAGVPFIAKRTDEPMRMVDLLRHTSGLTYGFQLARLPLEFSPGTSWNYSVSTDVLGAVVQRVSGMSLAEFFEQRIFKPLGMNDTFFTVPEDKRDRLVDCYTLVPGKGRVMFDRADESMWSSPFKLVSGGGGLVSTALDYQRFCQMCLNGGTLDSTRILGRKTIELMTQNHLPGGADLSAMSKSLFSETQNAGTGFGLGFAVTIDTARSMMPGSVGEYYWGGMFSTAFFIDPVERVTMVFMTQLSPSMIYPIRRELKTMIYSALT